MDKNLDIRADERNYRIHGDKNKALIRKSLEDCGAGRSIVVDNTGATIGGAGVLEQADAMGIPKRIVETDGSELVVVVRKDIAPDDPRRLRLEGTHAGGKIGILGSRAGTCAGRRTG